MASISQKNGGIGPRHVTVGFILVVLVLLQADESQSFSLGWQLPRSAARRTFTGIKATRAGDGALDSMEETNTLLKVLGEALE